MVGSERRMERKVITDAEDLRRDYRENTREATQLQAKSETHFADQLGSQETMDRYRAAILQIDEATAVLEDAARGRIARSDILVAQDADALANELREYERKLSVLGEARKVLEDMLEAASSEKGEPLDKRLEAYRAASLADKEAKSNLYDAGEHLRANEEVYKQAAVDDARTAGVEVDYPPYTEPQPEQPTTPAQPDVFPSPPTPES